MPYIIKMDRETSRGKKTDLLGTVSDSSTFRYILERKIPLPVAEISQILPQIGGYLKNCKKATYAGVHIRLIEDEHNSPITYITFALFDSKYNVVEEIGMYHAFEGDAEYERALSKVKTSVAPIKNKKPSRKLQRRKRMKK